jgi:hypothetical protein
MVEETGVNSKAGQGSVSRTGKFDMPRSTGTKRTGSDAASSKSPTTSARSDPKPLIPLGIRPARPVPAGEITVPVLKPSTKPGEVVLVNLAICLDDSDDADLIRGKTYRVLNDRQAAADGYLRIVDESGGDYLYANDRFLVIKKRMTSCIAEKLFS